MRLDAKTGTRGLFWNVATGTLIRYVIWADLPDNPEQEAEFEAFREEPQAALARGVPLSVIRYRGRARLRFVPAAPVFKPKATALRDLAGSLDEARRQFVRPKLLIVGEECSEPLCHALASWLVGWERLIEPEIGPDGRAYERAVTIAAKGYCSAHYRNPVQVSQRGVESEVEVDCRPQ
jgi:hypothetical protein